MKEILLVGLMVAAVASASEAQDSLDAAKDLYASAAYEEALSTLSRLSDGGGSAPAIVRQIDEYRAFCLYALGRTTEAESVAESLIRREPLAALDAADASPRIEEMFVSVRKRILPGLIRDQYRTTRALLDQKQYGAAEPRLAETRDMLSEAERLGVWDAGLADLSELVDGFLALSRATMETATLAPPQSTSAIPPPQSPPTIPPAQSTSAIQSPQPTSAIPPPQSTSAIPSEATGELRTYRIEDEDVTPPVTIYQVTPSVPAELLAFLRTPRRPIILDLTIDETGNVQKAEVRDPTNTIYDHLLVRAAAGWKYQPAMRNGVPVRYEKSVVLAVK
jgi:hypothetical protein